MSHIQQIDFVKQVLSRFPEFSQTETLLEIGSQNINGTIRDLIEARNYIGVDLSISKDVDFQCQGEFLELPDAWCDVVVSTECFEHAEHWKRIAMNAIRTCKPGGLIIFTFAGLYRPAHGTTDSDTESSPFTNQYYSNISIDSYANSIALNEYFNHYGIEAQSDPGDTYFWGIRSGSIIAINQATPTTILVDRLSRAQGQLGQALSRLANANKIIAEYEQNIQRSS